MSIYRCSECEQQKDNDECCCNEVDNELVCEDCIESSYNMLLVENEREYHKIYSRIHNSTKLTKAKKNRLKGNLQFLNEKIQKYISEGIMNISDIGFTYRLLF